MSRTVIRTVDPRSPAQRAGVRPGEKLLEINGHPIVDVLDYKFYSYDPRLELVLQTKEGDKRTLRLRKGEGEDLGLEFETYLMDAARSCANNCIFCFVDQMPPGMRKSLYFKDDDARLSFLMGNYLTLTNLSQREVAALLNVRQNTYSQYEIGVLNYPIDVLIRLACYYNTSVDYLLGLTDERTPYPRAKNRDF